MPMYRPVWSSADLESLCRLKIPQRPALSQNQDGNGSTQRSEKAASGFAQHARIDGLTFAVMTSGRDGAEWGNIWMSARF